MKKMFLVLGLIVLAMFVVSCAPTGQAYQFGKKAEKVPRSKIPGEVDAKSSVSNEKNTVALPTCKYFDIDTLPYDSSSDLYFLEVEAKKTNEVDFRAYCLKNGYDFSVMFENEFTKLDFSAPGCDLKTFAGMTIIKQQTSAGVHSASNFKFKEECEDMDKKSQSTRRIPTGVLCCN